MPVLSGAAARPMPKWLGSPAGMGPAAETWLLSVRTTEAPRSRPTASMVMISFRMRYRASILSSCSREATHTCVAKHSATHRTRVDGPEGIGTRGIYGEVADCYSSEGEGRHSARHPYDTAREGRHLQRFPLLVPQGPR